MAQQLEWPAIPGTQPAQYQSVVKSLLGHIHRESPDDKALRRYMRSRSIYDKETAPSLFNLLGLTVKRGQPTRMTAFGKSLFDIDDPVEWQKTLFRELARRNEILLKYVFDSLAERLYSVNEMYRGVTSYAYPGRTITLVNFRNWFGWIEATGMIKYIGIRWGPSNLAKEVDEYLKSIDLEELLEEEEEEEQAEAEDAEAAEGAGATAESAPAAPAPAADEDDDVVDSGLTDAPEPLPDMPPEPSVPDMEDMPDMPDMPPGAAAPLTPTPAPAAATAPAAAAPVATTTEPMATYRSVLTLRAVAEIQEVQKVLELEPSGPEVMLKTSGLDEAEIAKNLEGMRDQWGTPHGRDILGFLSFHIAPRDYTKRSKKPVKSYFLYRALAAATCAFRRVVATGAGIGPINSPVNRFRILDESGALSRHFEEGQPLDEVVSALVAAGHGARPDILALMPYLALARQALSVDDSEQWITGLQKATDAKAIWDEVYQRLHAGVFDIELIWVVRELVRHELWKKCDELKQTLVVPSQDVLDIAFRLGMVPTPYVGSFSAALYASRSLTGFSGEEHGLEAGLLHFAEHLGCSYSCRHASECSYFCREKLRR